MRLTRIYVLLHPDTNEIRYVGKTVDTLNRRLSRHINDSQKNTYRTANWISSIVKLGKRPLVLEIEQVYDDWVEAECFWISYFKSLGANLTNNTLGGEGVPGLVRSVESRKRISEGHKGIKPSLECIARLKKALTGRSLSEEHKANLRKAALGKKMSLEARAKMRANNLGKIMPQEVKDKISAGVKRFRNSSPLSAE